jgi:hypothetical protein
LSPFAPAVGGDAHQFRTPGLLIVNVDVVDIRRSAGRQVPGRRQERDEAPSALNAGLQLVATDRFAVASTPALDGPLS